MSRNVSLAELRAWARQMSDTEGDPNILDSELNALANRHLTEVFDRLVDAGSPDYYAATAQITTTNGIIEYPLEVDFRNLVGVFVRESSDIRRALMPMGTGARGNYKAPTGAWTLDIEYIPTAPILEDDGDTFDGVSGWEELIANLMAKDVMKKRESDPSVVLNDIARLEARITSRGRNRDKGQAKRVTDLDEATDWLWPRGWGTTSRIACYRLRADNLELYEQLYWGVP